MTLTTQGMQCVLTVLDSALVGAFAIRGHFMAKEGVPEGWRRIIADDKVCSESFRMLQLIFMSRSMHKGPKRTRVTDTTSERR